MMEMPPHAVFPHDLWNVFRDHFLRILHTHDEATIFAMWQGFVERNAFYSEKFMPQLAEALGCGLTRERFRCDFCLETKEGVPLVFLEVENTVSSASHEIRALCAMAAPLKVLVITCGWLRSDKDRYLGSWSEIIRTHHQTISLNCLYAIVAGEWHDDEPLVYSFTLVDPSGMELRCDREEIHFSARASGQVEQLE